MIRRALLLAAGASLAVGGLAGPASAADPDVPDDRRVLAISVPGLRWDDLDRPEVPTLRALLDDSAVANLATRVTRVVAEPGEAYLTLGAGTRAVAPPLLAGLAYEGDEPIGLGTAAEEYARQQGRALREGGVAVLSWPLLLQRNAAAEFDATLGALGQALADASVHRGVVGNADADDPLETEEPTRRRELVAALADQSGSVPCGAVGPDLLEEDPTAPFGVRLDQDAVVAGVARCSTAGSVVLVEASDLRRATAFQDRTAAPLADAARSEALARTDALVAALLTHLDPERDAVVVVAPTTDPEPGLGVLGIRAEELPAGLLTSGSTRRAGYVLLTDLAPSIAALAGVGMDEGSLEGRRVQVEADGRSGAERRHHLVEAEAAAVFRDSVLDPVVFTYMAAVSALALLAATAFVRGWRRAEAWLEQAALVLVAVPAWTYLAALFPFHDWGATAYWVFVVGGSLVVGIVARLLRRAWLRPILLTYGALVGVVVLSVVLLGSRLQLSTVFGDSPIVAGRFSGINNVTFALFLGAAIVLACAIVHLVPGQRGRQMMVGFLVAVLLVDVAPMWGADVGGALAGLPALALVATGLGRWKVRWRTVVITAAATVALVVALGLLDLTRAPADRSHLGRLFERIASDGTGGLTTVVERKLTVNLRSLTTSPWRYLFAPLALAAGVMVWRGRQRTEAVVAAFPALRRAVPGFAAAAVLGYAANDSGIAVPAAMLALVVPGLVYLACRVGPDTEMTT